jgi:hypothetical protein
MTSSLGDLVQDACSPLGAADLGTHEGKQERERAIYPIKILNLK